MRTAIVATVLNEARHIKRFLESLERQTRIADVIVVTDGGSTDATPEILRAFRERTQLPFQWESVPGNRSAGRNAAIRLTDADAIAVTDVNILEPEWFERIIEPLVQVKADVVAGWYEPIGETPSERAMGLMTVYAIEQIDARSFVPASRSIAFTKVAWERAGRYDERLDAAEDTHLALAMRRAAMRFVFERRAVVRCWVPGSLREAFHTYRAYANADGQARHFAAPQTRYGRLFAAYATGPLLMILGIWWAPAWIVLLAGLVAYASFRVRKVLRARLFAQVPRSVAIGVVIDIAQMIGYAKGRLRAPRDSVVRRGMAGPR